MHLGIELNGRDIILIASMTCLVVFFDPIAERIGAWTQSRPSTVDMAQKPDKAAVAKTLSLRPGKDGRYYLHGKINAADTWLLVDTGASMNVLNPDDAKKAGIHWEKGEAGCLDGFSGSVCGVWTSVALIETGGISRRNVRVFVASKDFGVSLLGIPFLNSLSRLEFNGATRSLTLTD